MTLSPKRTGVTIHVEAASDIPMKGFDSLRYAALIVDFEER